MLKTALKHAWALSLAPMLLLPTASMATEAAEEFATILLPRGISISLPKNWDALSHHQRIHLDRVVESRLDLSGIEYQASELPFAANYFDDHGNSIAILNVRYHPELELSQDDARNATRQDIDELDAAIKESLLQGMEAFGMSIGHWNGTAKADINGIVAFITEYSRSSQRLSGNFNVRLVRVFVEDRSITLTISYLDSAAIMLGPIINQIIHSLRIADLDPPTTHLDSRTETYSRMSALYGEHWPIVLLISALTTWGIGLTPPLLMRFVFVRRPIGRGGAIGFVALFWIVNVTFFAALGSQSKSHGALVLVAFVSYAILRKGSRKVAGSAVAVSQTNK